MKRVFAPIGAVILTAFLGVVVAPPAAADDIAMFRVDGGVRVGRATLAPGTYVFLFRTSGGYPGVALVYDENRTQVLAAAIVQREGLEASEISPVGEITYDFSIRSVRHDYWRYTFAPVKKPVSMASGPALVAPEIALAR